jgi:uncharacterized protein
VREPHHATQRELQDRFDTRRLADRLVQRTPERISEGHRAFIEVRKMFLIATADPEWKLDPWFEGTLPE